MGYLKGIAGTGILLAAWICANAATPPTQDQQTPDSMYYVKTDYGWTMSSTEPSGYYTFSSPLRLKMRISFSDLGDGGLQMQLHFYEVSYTDQSHNWTITDFSSPEKIRERFYEHCRKGANLKHFTELAAFEEEALGYLMAMSHGMTFVIYPSQDTATTFSKLRGEYQTLWTGIQPAGSGPASALEAYNSAVEKYKRAAGDYQKAAQERQYYQKAVKERQREYQRATQEYQRATTEYATLRTLQNYPRLGMMWTQQMRDLAMFARQPDYKTLTPCRASLSLYQTVQRLRGTGSAVGNQMQVPEVPAFSLNGLYRWLPMHQALFAHVDAATTGAKGVGGKVAKGGGTYNVQGLGGAVNAPGAWFLGTDKTYHTVEEALDKTSSGSVEYRRIKVESRLDGVDAFAILPDGKGIRATITVTAKTTLEATLFDPAASIYLDKLVAAERLEEQAVAAVERNNYDKAIALYQEHLRTYPGSPRARPIGERLAELAAMKAEQTRQRLAELAAMKAEQEQKRLKSLTQVAEFGLRNGRPDIARIWLTKIVSEFPETPAGIEAQERLSNLLPVSMSS